MGGEQSICLGRSGWRSELTEDVIVNAYLLMRFLVDRDDIIKWDMAETAKGGPFQEILDVDIFVNCIYLTSAIPPFITAEYIKTAGSSRRLSVVVDASCDTTNPYNPIPIYSVNTTLPEPTVDLDLGYVTSLLLP